MIDIMNGPIPREMRKARGARTSRNAKGWFYIDPTSISVYIAEGVTLGPVTLTRRQLEAALRVMQKYSEA